MSYRVIMTAGRDMKSFVLDFTERQSDVGLVQLILTQENILNPIKQDIKFLTEFESHGASE